MNATPTLLQRLFSLDGKVALITGASGGIGSVLALALAEVGAAIAVHGRAADKVEQTCHEIVKAGGRAISLLADLEDVEACRALIGKTTSALGRLDILTNNAGANRRKPIQDVTLDDFDFITAVNQRSVYFLSQAAQPIMRDLGGGKIIHIGSINIFYGLDGVSIYGIAKGAVGQLTKVMAVEWAKDNIQVNCITPGFVATPLSKAVWDDPHKAQWLLDRIPMRRASLPEDLIGATLMLASPASAYITGQNIVVDGGFLAGGSWNQEGVE